jgi:hypothetical protein
LNKWIKLSSIILVVVVICGLAGFNIVQASRYTEPIYSQSSFAQSLETSSQERLPISDYASTGTWAVFPSTTSTKWDKVDDGESDADTTYLTLGTTAGYALFNFTAFDVPLSAIITKLEITYISRDVTVGVNNIRSAIRVGGTNYLTTDTGIDSGANYLSITYAYKNNPKTLTAWTVDDINGKGSNPLQQFGVNSSDANPIFRITSVKAKVSYTEVVTTNTPPVYPAMDDGVITMAELITEATSDAREGSLTTVAWDKEITISGISHIDDKLLADFVNDKPQSLTDMYNQLFELYMKAPVKDQVSQTNTGLLKLETQKATLTSALTAAKVGGDKDVIQQAANKVAAVDGKISELSQPLQIASQINELERSITVAKNKFKLATKEQELRLEGEVSREYLHTTYYMDFTPATHSHLTGTITFTNASGTVTGDGSNFDPEVTVGDYIRQSDGTQWYKVSARASDTSLTITPVLQQATHTDDANASFLCVSATNTGAAIATAFPHLNRYTTDTARTAGDILKVRANQTNVIAGVNITFDEAGTVTAYDEIRGCSVADDPFSDASNVQPIFDFGNTAFQVTLSKAYWRLYNLTVTNNTKAYDGLITLTGIADNVDTCTVFLNNNANGHGITNNISVGYINNCTVYSNKYSNIYQATGLLNISGCIINGGAATTDYGVYSAGCCMITNTTIGATTSHDTASVRTSFGYVILHNSTLADSTPIVLATYEDYMLSEDNDQVLGAQKAWYSSGTVTKSSTVLRTGGGSSSALMLPSSVCTIKYPLNIAHGSLNPDFAIWCPASPTTITVYMRANTIWATYPTAAQLFIQADYWAGATAIRSQSTASTQTLVDTRDPAGAGTYTADAGTNTTTVVDAGLAGTAYVGKYLYNSTRSAGAEITTYDNGTKTIGLGSAIASQTSGDTYYVLDWVGFTTTFTPGTAGFAYLKLNLGLYASGKGIYCDVTPLGVY